MIKMQWLPLILNGKSKTKPLFCLYEEIIDWVTNLFDFGLFKIQFCFVIYIYIIFTFCYVADAFI